MNVLNELILHMFVYSVLTICIIFSAREADCVHLQPQLEDCAIPNKDTLEVFGAMDPRVHCHSDNAEVCKTFSGTPGVRVMVTCVDDKWMGLGPRCEYSLANLLLENVRNVGPMYDPQPIHEGSVVEVEKFKLQCEPDEPGNPDIFTLYAYVRATPYTSV